VEASEAQLDEWGVSAIHLMDSEGDDYLTGPRPHKNADHHSQEEEAPHRCQARWLVLGRGYDDLLILEAGFLLASQKSDQS
jgi:hypothetical protein